MDDRKKGKTDKIDTFKRRNKKIKYWLKLEALFDQWYPLPMNEYILESTGTRSSNPKETVV